jgi:DNA helicase-2/ATP-dependent DNA helicase PcrA
MTSSQTAHEIIFGNLNEEQKLAVTTLQGPVLILAGAGSGKTRALTHRIAYLLDQGVQPWQILAVTFTNKAANEMKERIKNLLHLTEGQDSSPWQFGQGRLPVMGTFHSICVRILRRDIERLGRDRSFVIYDQDDQEKLMKNVLKSLNIPEADLKARAALTYVSRFKSEAVLPPEARVQATSDRMQKVVDAYTKYQTALKESNALDFDDLLLETVRLFHECPDVLDRYQETWRYLHVDEYQDTNHVQYLFITLLAQKYRNLCVIGDPDQSIYGFRGADIRNILEFEQEYKDAVRIKLEQNYRSAQPVLTAADAVIAANPDRPQKNMWTERKDGPPVIVHEVRDERAEAEEIIRSIRLLERDGVPLNEQVILYRTHAQSRLFEEACMRMGVAYRILGGLKFYLRKEVKDVLAYLYVILNPYDTVSLLRIINVPTRKIGDTTMEKIRTHAEMAKLTLWDALRDASSIHSLDAGTKERIERFITLIERHKARRGGMTVQELAASIIEDTGMREWYADNTEEGEERWRNVRELLTVMRKYDDLPPETSLTGFLEEVALVSEVDKLNDMGKDMVTLMTLHLCKGLEFEAVHVAGCEEGIFPHSNSMFDKEQLEEERRIMYVGITRAKTHLKLFFARTRFQWGEQKTNPPSRFLDDLPEAVTERRSDDILSAFAWSAGRAGKPGKPTDDLSMEFNQDLGDDDSSQVSRAEIEAGSRVEHPSFGRGTVKSRRGDVVDILFDSGQKKTFALSIAPLRVI